MQELRPDAAIEALSARNILNVGPDLLAQVGHLVDEGDLGREEGVRRILDESAVRRPVNMSGVSLMNSGR